MSTTYTMTMNNGETCRYSCASAGEAIYKALHKFPGKTVAKCHSGLTADQANDLRQSGKDGVMVGFVTHDVPPHQPLVAKPEEA